MTAVFETISPMRCAFEDDAMSVEAVALKNLRIQNVFIQTVAHLKSDPQVKV